MCVYIYIYRERERETYGVGTPLKSPKRDLFGSSRLGLPGNRVAMITTINIYIYIYIYTYIYIYIYIYPFKGQ